jgi:hypothetical protein
MTLDQLAWRARVRADVFDCPSLNELQALCDVLRVVPSDLVAHAESGRWKR